jgi:hypothetical protein
MLIEFCCLLIGIVNGQEDRAGKQTEHHYH